MSVSLGDSSHTLNVLIVAGACDANSMGAGFIFYCEKKRLPLCDWLHDQETVKKN